MLVDDSSTRLFRCALFLALIVSGSNSGGSVAAATIGNRAIRSLKENVDSLSPIEIVWTRQYHSDLDLPSLMRKIKYPDHEKLVFDKPCKYIYRWQDGMSYMYWEFPAVFRRRGVSRGGSDSWDVRLNALEIACDLTKIYRGNGEGLCKTSDRGCSLTIDSIDDPRIGRRDDVCFSPSYFHEAGYCLPRTIGELRRGARSLVLDLIEKGARVMAVGPAKLSSTDCLLIEIRNATEIYRFYLDAALGYAVRRREELSSLGGLEKVAEMSDFVRSAEPHLWLPKRCRIVHYTWSTIRPLRIPEGLVDEELTVERVDRHRMAQERFALKYQLPGTIIDDATVPQAKQRPDRRVRYRVAASEEELTKMLQESRGSGALIIIVNLCAAIILLVVYFWGRSRRKAPQVREQ